ncbi:MAG: hypothetical protein CMJ80_12375 [Planctomycetaceae bacterium]|nr:hypothetical protein [Planctomycetaceae bacterium]
MQRRVAQSPAAQETSVGTEPARLFFPTVTRVGAKFAPRMALSILSRRHDLNCNGCCMLLH